MTKVKMDFIKDVSEILKGQMRTEGFDPRTINHEEDGISLYIRSRRVSIPTQPRRVHYPKNFDTQGHAEGIKRLEEVFRSGDNTSPYRSRGYESLKPDFLLDYLGMHHFHLGEIRDSGVADRTNHLLIARVEPEDVYFLKIAPHVEEPIPVWYQQELMDIAGDNWLELKKKLEIKESSGVKPKRDNEFVKATRGTNLVSMYESSGGAVYFPLGKADEVLSQITANRYKKGLDRAQREITERIREISRDAKILGHHFPEEVSLNIIGFDSLGTDEFFHLDLREKKTGYRFKHWLR